MDNQGGDIKPKFKGNWSCGKCSASITELPFEPSPDRLDQLQCFDCHKKARDARGGGNGPKQMHEGSWTCSMCGNAITKLPFKPNSTEGLKCIDCFKASKA